LKVVRVKVARTMWVGFGASWFDKWLERVFLRGGLKAVLMLPESLFF
jgi:hypothetical protein